MSMGTRPGAIWREIFKNLARKPVTVRYPAVPMELPPNFRGRPVFDPKNCIGCRICERDCPSAAIKITKVAEKTWACTFSLDRCIYCGQCADSCPKKTIHMSQIYEMATFDRNQLFDTVAGEPPPPPQPPPGIHCEPPLTSSPATVAPGASLPGGETETGTEESQAN